MINRTIIRIKVLQIVYAYYQKNSNDLVLAENELMFGLQKSYDLYHTLLILILQLTYAEQKRIDKLKNKLLATDEERNPSRRLSDNRLADLLNSNKQIQKFAHEKGLFTSNDNYHFIRSTLNKILQSEIFQQYIESDNTFESDRNFWVKILKELILKDDDLTEYLENESIYWNDDLDVIGTFAIKTIRRLSVETPAEKALFPMFRSIEDKNFAIQLLHHSILEEKENSGRIKNQTSNWDIERLALMDLCILLIALAELRNFPSIPVNVTLNEYIDLARYYSTPKSPVFINGILDAIVKELKSEKLLLKD